MRVKRSKAKRPLMYGQCALKSCMRAYRSKRDRAWHELYVHPIEKEKEVKHAS